MTSADLHRVADDYLVSDAAAARPDNTLNGSRLAVCPMCHTPAPLTESAVAAGGDWRCSRCAQHWDADRLDTVAAYAVWVVEHDARRLRQEAEARDATPQS